MKIQRMLLALAIACALGEPSAFADQGKATGQAKAKAAKAAKDERKADQRPSPDRSRREERAVRFDRMDLDHDGRLGRNEWNSAAAAFSRADLDHDGIVSRTEYLDIAGNPPAGTRRNTNAHRAGYDRGLGEGREAGKEDRVVNGGKWDLDGQRELEQADSGYRADLGTRADYQAGYRAGFRVGYSEGFGPRR